MGGVPAAAEAAEAIDAEEVRPSGCERRGGEGGVNEREKERRWVCWEPRGAVKWRVL